MPTYEYACEACKHQFEEFQSITAAPLRKCPACGKSRLRRLLGIGAGVIFKGSGFYQTDYRSESYRKAAEADKPAADSPKPTAEAAKPATDSPTPPATPAKPDGQAKAGAPASSQPSENSAASSTPRSSAPISSKAPSGGRARRSATSAKRPKSGRK
ncbi:MAG: hypothetical protein IPM64_05500 [Phycisphaerales bacterium]|nr:hypothetical protein [Phycisphaerales bacterium]